MKRLILALVVWLLPHAIYAQTVSWTSPAPVQNGATAQVEEAAKLSASVTQLYAARNYKEALPLAERVLALLEKVRTEEDPLVGSALNNLAVLYLELKDSEKARPILERVLARREKLTTATSPTTASLLTGYVCLTSAQSRSQRGEVLKLIQRINAILLQDAVLAAGFPLPENLSELSRGIITDKNSKPQSSYPDEAKKERLQGAVLVVVEGDETGKVVNWTAVPCWGTRESLAETTVAAMRGAQFKRILIDGKSIKLKAVMTYGYVP